MKKAISSFSDLFDSQNLQSTGKRTLRRGSSLLLAFSCTMNRIIKTSKGRDKICGIIQYLADLYSCCLKLSNIENVRNLYLNDLFVSGLIAVRLKDSLSQARKIFRFLKFFGELKQIKSIIKSKKHTALKLLLSFSHGFSFFYYILDNALWMMNVGVFRDILSSHFITTTKSNKNMFSLLKVALQIFLSSLFYHLRSEKERKMMELLTTFQSQKPITVDSESYDICRAVLRQRAKKRYEGIDVFLSLLRILMLAKSLKFVRLHPIFVAFCGIVSTSISLSKMIFKEENQPKVEAFEFCEHEKETEAENGMYESKVYRNRRLKSSAKLISSSLLRLDRSKSISILPQEESKRQIPS